MAHATAIGWSVSGPDMGKHRYPDPDLDVQYMMISGASCSGASFAVFSFKQSDLSEAERGVENEQRIWESIVENHPFGRNGV
jgi:hypothetical protein